MSTDQIKRPPRPSERARDPALARAWTAVALVPLFFLIAFAVGEGVYALLGYAPENADAPVWVVVVALVPILAVALLPCVAAVFFGRRATAGGDRRGRIPLVLGLAAGAALLVLAIVSEVGNVVRR